MNRKETIQSLRDKRYTFQQIGNLFGISRQRVHQILHHQYIPRKYEYKYGQKIRLEGNDYLRELVRIRDNYTCQKCGKVWKEGQRRFDVHHLNLLESQTEAMKYENNKDLSQLITLCHKCHLNLSEHRNKMTKGLKEWHKNRKKVTNT